MRFSPVQMGVLLESRMSRNASGLYMSISSHISLYGSSMRAMRMQLSGLKLKLRSRQMSTSGPTASLKVPMSASICDSIALLATWSVVPGPPPKPWKWTVDGSPGWMMLVFRAV